MECKEVAELVVSAKGWILVKNAPVFALDLWERLASRADKEPISLGNGESEFIDSVTEWAGRVLASAHDEEGENAPQAFINRSDASSSLLCLEWRGKYTEGRWVKIRFVGNRSFHLSWDSGKETPSTYLLRQGLSEFIFDPWAVDDGGKG